MAFAATDVGVIDHAVAAFAASFVDLEATIVSAKPTDHEPIVPFPHGVTDLRPSLLR